MASFSHVNQRQKLFRDRNVLVSGERALSTIPCDANFQDGGRGE